jgi:hypothetical protein
MRKKRYLGLKIADPHHFNADPDPAFHIDADPDPASHFNEDPNPASLQVMGNCDFWYIEPPGLHFEPPGLHSIFNLQSFFEFLL